MNFEFEEDGQRAPAFYMKTPLFENWFRNILGAPVALLIDNKSPEDELTFWDKFEGFMFRLLQIAPGFPRGIKHLGAANFHTLSWWLGTVLTGHRTQFLWALKCDSNGDRLPNEVESIRDGFLRTVIQTPAGRTFADYTELDDETFKFNTGIAFILDIFMEVPDDLLFRFPNLITLQLQPMPTQNPVRLVDYDSGYDSSEDLEQF